MPEAANHDGEDVGIAKSNQNAGVLLGDVLLRFLVLLAFPASPEPKPDLPRSMHHRGIAPSAAEPSERARDPNRRRGRGVYRTCTRHLQPRLSQDAEGD